MSCTHERVSWFPIETQYQSDGTAEIWQQGTCQDCQKLVQITYSPDTDPVQAMP